MENNQLIKQREITKTQFFSFGQNQDDRLILDSGIRFGPVTIAYETYGTLNREKNNAILICHALSGDAHAAGYHSENDAKPGWWEDAVGPDKMFDTNQYYIICSNVIGGCGGSTGPASINPDTDKYYAMNFPVITIGDMVKVQKKLTDYLGIKKLLSVAGGSMGGMQTLEWGLRYPDSVQSLICIASTYNLSAQSIAFNAVGRNAILADQYWNNGNYYESQPPSKGLATARMIGHITYLSDESMRMKFGRNLQNKDNLSFDFSREFQVESYLGYQGEKFVDRFDANSYLYLTKALDYFDIAEQYGNGSLENAVENMTARSLFISFSSDWLFPPYQSRNIVKALMRHHKDVSYINIESNYGHDAFLLEIEEQKKIIPEFLKATYRDYAERSTDHA